MSMPKAHLVVHSSIAHKLVEVVAARCDLIIVGYEAHLGSHVHNGERFNGVYFVSVDVEDAVSDFPYDARIGSFLEFLNGNPYMVVDVLNR